MKAATASMSASTKPASAGLKLAVKRVYDSPSPADGIRVLVDRLWPRGLTKKKARVDLWLKEVSPSGELRKWFGHDPAKWPEFKRRYFAELAEHEAAVTDIAEKALNGPVTILFGARETRYNNAVAFKEFIETRILSKLKSL